MLEYSPSSLNFNINWRIKLNPIYRVFDNEEWVNDFLDNGNIRLSCFENFRKNPDEFQGDLTEGKGNLVLQDYKNNTHVFGFDSGINAFVLSTTSEINERIITDFNAKSGIKINHPTLFGLEIAKKIPFVLEGVEGNCNYVESKINFANKILNDKELESLNSDENKHLYSIIKDQMRGIELFSKPLKYNYQNEYRFIWFVKNQIYDSIIINCPEAALLCEKIDLSDF